MKKEAVIFVKYPPIFLLINYTYTWREEKMGGLESIFKHAYTHTMKINRRSKIKLTD